MKTVKVNHKACNTWLEPYIGWTFTLVREYKKRITFLMDCGTSGNKIFGHDKKLFDIQETA